MDPVSNPLNICGAPTRRTAPNTAALLSVSVRSLREISLDDGRAIKCDRTGQTSTTQARVKSSGMRVGSTKRKRSERKVTRMVSIVVAVFVLCWLPFYVFNVTSVTSSIKPTPAVKSTFDCVVVLGYANSCANPILYAFLSDNFKKSFQNVLCLKKVAGLDEMERSDSRADRSRMVHDAVIIGANLETHNASLLNGELQTSI